MQKHTPPPPDVLHLKRIRRTVPGYGPAMYVNTTNYAIVLKQK